MDLTTISIVVSVVIASITAIWSIYNMVNTQLAKHGDLLLKVSTDIASLAGKQVTLQSCVLNTREAENRMLATVAEAKAEVLEEVEAVEYRLDKRISKLEEKR